MARGRDFESLRQASTLHGVTKVPKSVIVLTPNLGPTRPCQIQRTRDRVSGHQWFGVTFCGERLQHDLAVGHNERVGSEFVDVVGVYASCRDDLHSRNRLTRGALRTASGPAICANHSSSTSDPTRSKVTATVTATRSVSPRCTRLLSLTRRSPSCTRSQHVVADAEICHDAAPSPSA